MKIFGLQQVKILLHDLDEIKDLLCDMVNVSQTIPINIAQ